MKVALFALLALAIIGGVVLYIKFRPIPDQYEPLGPFDLVTHTHRYLTGYNEGRIHRATTESYSLRYRGKPFSFTGKAGMYGDRTAQYTGINSLVTFPSPEPAVVVNVGDPNNTSFFYLVHEREGNAAADYLGEGHGGVSAEWLDPAPADSTTVTNVALHRGRLSGGRYLLLGASTVLDVNTLKSYPVKEAYGAYPNQFKPPISFSPDHSSFVRYGSGSENESLFIVFDFLGDSTYLVPLDRRIMRYNTWEEMDQTWFNHYYEWRDVPGGHQRLAAREGVTPLPYKGQLVVDQYDSTYIEYNLLPVKAEMRETVVEFIEREFQGKRQGPDLSGSTIELLVGSDTVNVLLHEDQVGIFVNRGGDPGIIRRIGERLDQALATGRYDQLFLP